MSTFIIAEAGSSHDNDISKAYRLIEAAKASGADAVKFQWTSNGKKMAERRGLGADAAAMYQTYLEKPLKEWLGKLCYHAQQTGIEFMCTTYLLEDIPAVAYLPGVKRLKISAFEADWDEFVYAHKEYGKQVIISKNPGKRLPDNTYWADVLHCISEYPTPIEHLKIGMQNWKELGGGLSDHTTSTLTGALAVAAGATIVEKHIRLDTTSESNPDYPHSLEAANCRRDGWTAFGEYVSNIREAERAL